MKISAFALYLFIDALLAVGLYSDAIADDTDIYLRTVQSPDAAPMVMFSLDYRPDLGATVCTNISINCPAADYFENYPATAAWMHNIIPAGGRFEYFDMLRLALHLVLSQHTGLKVGLMMSHADEVDCAGVQNSKKCSNGGYIIRGVQELQPGDANGAFAAFEEALFSIPLPQGALSHSFQGKELYFELFRYQTGHKVYNAFNGYVDFATDRSLNLNEEAAHMAAAWDESIIIEKWNSGVKAYDSYVSPFADSAPCVKSFVINFYGGKVNRDANSDDAIRDTKANGGMAGINLTGTNNSFRTVVAYLRDADLADGTYGIDIGAAPALPGKQGVASYFLTAQPVKDDHELAIAGGTGKALALTDNPEDLVNTLNDIFLEVLSVSTTFVSASVPVNVFNRAESLDSVFIALFQAEERRAWPGNLKKLKLRIVESPIDHSKRLELQDVNDEPAIALDGRIKYDALTYWTDAASLPAPVNSQEVAGRDGRVIARGAAGQRIPGFSQGFVGTANDPGGGEPADAGARKVLRDVGVGRLLGDLNADAATASALRPLLGVATDDEAKNLLLWIRGIDPATGEIRPWILGDPLHSRPLPINYGLRDGHTDEENPLIYIAMASNDGFMHFFRNTDGNENELGKEVWAFMPNEVMDEITSLKENPADRVHPYTVDGAPSVFILNDNGDGTVSGTETVMLYFGLRRGGTTYYALDVTDPDHPALKWKKGHADLPLLGQTWSRPTPGHVDHDSDGVRDPVIIVGGGYDPNKDLRGGSIGTGDLQGSTVYVLDARTGEAIWTASHPLLVDSVPSDVTAVDTDGDKLVDRIVVGDTGGNVWRIDTFGKRDNWQITLLAALGRHANSGTVNDRRFFHKPDYVLAQQQSIDTTTGVVTLEKFDAIVIGSGNRANPLDQEYAVPPDNYLYMIRDTRIFPADRSGNPSYVIDDQLSNIHDNFGDITDTSNLPTLQGWRLKLNAGVAEKSLSSPLTISNTVYFTSYLPNGTYEDEVPATDPTTCSPSEGAGLLYAVDLRTGLAAYNYNTADDSNTDGGTSSARDRYTSLSSAGIPADVVGINIDGQAHILPPDLSPVEINSSYLWKTFWYEMKDSTF